MSALPYLDEAALRRHVPMAAAIAAVEALFAADDVEVPRRSHLATRRGDLLLMPAWGPRGTGVKLVTVNPSNPPAGKPLVNGVYVLFSPDTLEPVLLIDGAAVTALRTPAVSAVATKHLARPDARRLVIFGAGTQAAGHLDAMQAVRPIDSVVVVARSGSSAGRLVETARERGLDARSGTPADVAGADVVCTCTTSATPLFDGHALRSGTHVNAVGAYKPHARELDDAAMRRADVFVEDREAALAEAGDVVQAVASGALDPSSLVALSDLVRAAGHGASDVTVFKSVGLASEDLAVAVAALAALG